jgi:hypothetical protein
LMVIELIINRFMLFDIFDNLIFTLVNSILWEPKKRLLLIWQVFCG